MTQASERTKIAQEVLDNHAEKLKSEFSTVEERQDLFIDVFGNDVGSSEKLAGLQNQFANGTLRPEVKFVSDEVLTDKHGNIRDAAFDRENQTILLSEDLDAAGIESSIQQEIGHWWDVLLNENQDTVTEDGKPFDEGTAYAERFGEGAKGDNIFSDVVYQNDFHAVFVNGQETNVEFRPIATWNIQGNTHTFEDSFENEIEVNTLQRVLDIMERPGPGIGPIEVMALQEVTLGNLRERLEGMEGVTNFVERPPLVDVNDQGNTVVVYEFTFQRNGNEYLFFYNNQTLGEGIGNAIVLRNPPRRDRITPLAFVDPENPQNQRGYLAVETPEGIYYNIHARSNLGDGPNQNNNADRLITEILNRHPEGPRVFILGDFNRDIATPDNHTGNIGAAFPLFDDILRPPSDNTYNARDAEPSSTLDYMFTEADLLNGAGTVLNGFVDARQQAFPSDHFPVLYDDEIASFEGGDGTVTAVFVSASPPSELAVLGENIPLDEGVEITGEDNLSFDFLGNGRNTSSTNYVSVRSENSQDFTFPRSRLEEYSFYFKGLRKIENVVIDEVTNTTGIAPNDIDITYGDTVIRINMEGLTVPTNTGFDLIVTFGDSFPS